MNKKLILLGSLIIVILSSGTIAQISPSDSPVSFTINNPDKVKAGKQFTVEVDFKTLGDWYIHAPTGVNRKQGMIETVVSFECPDGIKLSGNTEFPPPIPKGAYQIYKGKGIKYKQSFTTDKNFKKKTLEITCLIEYQTCNSSLCQPPVNEEIKLKIKLR